MTFTEFLLLVARMREAQRAFYSQRTQSSLIEAKAAEAAVDKAIRLATHEIGQVDDSRQMALDLPVPAREVRTTTHNQPTLTVDQRQENRHR